MNRILVTVLISMLYVAVHAQADNEGLKKAFKEYFNTVQLKNSRKTIEYIYPKLFDLVPKEMMIAAMDKVYADPAVSIGMKNSSLKGIADILDVDGAKYTLVKYSFTMNMIIHGEVDTTADGGEIETEMEEEESSSSDFMYEIFKEQYGAKNITYYRARREFDIRVNNEMYAIWDSAYDNWKFLEKKENLKTFTEKILPQEALKKL